MIATDDKPSSAPRAYAFDISLGEVDSVTIAEFDRYWRSKRRGDRLPSRADIDPAEIKRLLPSIVLLDVEREPFRVRIRLVGTRTAEFRGDNTGKYLDQLTSMSATRRADYIAEMRYVATQARPAFARDWITTNYGVTYRIFAGIWPLAADGRQVDKLVVIEDFGSLNARQMKAALAERPDGHRPILRR